MTLFVPDVEIRAGIEPVVHQDIIVQETLLYSASPEFARSYGGPLTRAALDKMHRCLAVQPPAGFYWVINTRSHMLMPGQYPAIPGWHCDAVPRRGYEEQPNLAALRDDIQHLAIHVSTHEDGVSDTQFMLSEMDIPTAPTAVWKSVHIQVTGPTDQERYESTQPGDGALVKFTMPTLHRASHTTNRGWRWWIRASMYYHRPINEIRRQVQVYTSEEGGW